MSPLKAIALAALSLLPRTTFAQDAVVEEHCFNGACLDRQESGLYTATEEAVSQGVGGCASTDACVARVVALDRLIAELKSRHPRL